MKKRLAMTLIGALILSVAMTACGAGGGGPETSGKKEQPVEEGGKTRLTLSVQEITPFYEALERKFEAKYPDIDLNIQAYKQAGEESKPGDLEEYRKSINTELLSGQGADVFELDNLPVGDYVGKGLLLNMDSLLSQDKTVKTDDVQMNVLEAMKESGGLYAVPAGFSLRAFIGDGEVLKDAGIQEETWTWQDFAAVAKTLTQGKEGIYAMADYPPEMLTQEMVVDSYGTYVDSAAKKAKFDSPEFVALLQQVKKMYDDGIMTGNPAELGKQLFYSAVLFEPADVINVTHTYFDHPQLLQKPHSAEQSGTMRIIPLTQFGIRAKTPVQEEAWKLVSFLLSEEAQSIRERSGFSLLKSVNGQKLDEIKQQIGEGTYKLPDGKAVKAENEEFTRFQQLLDKVDQYSQLDGKVIAIVGEESLAFFSGQKSAEEAAKLIQNRVTTFLNE
ncbi:extracellular solute-binding protein [Paenibacillus macerans]|uniref:Extracellular solute-binding protein n=1 Tax=Paenibacillus macerans TaxID=44252 RepID=A0A6N8ER25_PAEMA|nr:ABC transporter substrate-binding protein [Paenibacillus macerans]MUG21210.1 extracellular solute-binding protein [Paenibacillus macerans]